MLSQMVVRWRRKVRVTAAIAWNGIALHSTEKVRPAPGEDQRKCNKIGSIWLAKAAVPGFSQGLRHQSYGLIFKRPYGLERCGCDHFCLLIAREPSQTAIQLGGTGHEIRTLGL